MDYIGGNELKKKYMVYGEFYNLKYSDGLEIKCRKLLEIINKDYVEEINMRDNLDAVFIMMNPGMSRPLDDNVKQPLVREKDILNNEIVNIPLVEAKPDSTQYQIMRVMEIKRWKHVRIINLSDIREPKSKIFYDFVRKTDNNLHSIFDKRRAHELKQCISNRENKIIAAWGKDKSLDKLINLAISSELINERIGVNSSDDKKHYSHGSPLLDTQKKQWLRDIIAIINEK
ncbi:MAG: hypothetical protein GX275_05035 [Clostridiales bacterium]|nr:hypothetical protein [Clostridiales bacterium]